MTSRRLFLSALVAGTALAGLPAAVRPAWATIEDEAKTFLADLGNRAIDQLTDRSASEQARVDSFRALLVEAVDFSLISQQVLGTYWRNAEPAVRDDFNNVLRETLIQRFLPLFDSYEGETFEVVSTRTSSKDPSVVGATTHVLAPNGNIAKVEWYMKKFDDRGLRIYDFSAEGIRLTISLQDEYNAVLRRNDGDVALLVEEMKQKLPGTAKL